MEARSDSEATTEIIVARVKTALSAETQFRAGTWPETQTNVTYHCLNSSQSRDPDDLLYYELLLVHPHITMRDELFRYVTPLLILFGNASNLLTWLVLRRQGLRRQSPCFFLMSICWANLLVLDMLQGSSWLCFVLDKPYIEAMSDWGCRLWTFLSNMISYCGIWFVVMLAVDRAIFVGHSHLANSYCTVFSAKVLTLAVLIGLMVVSVHAMWTFELHREGCFIGFEQDNMHVKVWPLFSATVYSYLPLTLLLVLSVVLAVSLCLKRQRLKRSAQTAVSGQDDFAATTLVVTILFFLLTMPATVINLVDIYLPMAWLSLDLIAQIELAKKIAEIMYSSNQASLGVILLLSSRAFRQELRAMICCSLKRRPKVYEMSQLSKSSEQSDCNPASCSQTPVRCPENGDASRNYIDYEVCNNCDAITERM